MKGDHLRTLEPSADTLPRYQVDIVNLWSGEIISQPGYPGTDDKAAAEELRNNEAAACTADQAVNVRDRRSTP